MRHKIQQGMLKACILFEALLKLSINSYSHFLFIGYECPHKDLMNHLQINLGRWKSKISTAFPILPGLFVKDFNMDEEGQFILKPRNSARIQQQSESSILLQVPSQFSLHVGIKHQCFFSFSCLGRGSAENKPNQNYDPVPA